jgi:hypothetical protein
MNSFRHTRRRLAQALSCFVFLVGSTMLLGCGGGGGGASVSGKVLYKSEPVKGGSLTFVPVA